VPSGTTQTESNEKLSMQLSNDNITVAEKVHQEKFQMHGKGIDLKG